MAHGVGCVCESICSRVCNFLARTIGAEIIKRAFVCVSVDNRQERERMCGWCQTLVGGSRCGADAAARRRGRGSIKATWNSVDRETSTNSVRCFISINNIISCFVRLSRCASIFRWLFIFGAATRETPLAERIPPPSAAALCFCV